FFQAEDGIRYDLVTGVQTCALPISRGNDTSHIILRGSNHDTNYDADSISAVEKTLKHAELPPYLMVDCSHGNSHKDHTRQALVEIGRASCRERRDIVVRRGVVEEEK